MKHLIKQPKKNQQLNFDITKFTFLRDLVLVETIKEESSNGLINPNQYEDKMQFGKILKCGNGVNDLKVGDIIRFGLYSTENIRTQGHDYYVVHEEDVTAVL